MVFSSPLQETIYQLASFPNDQTSSLADQLPTCSEAERQQCRSLLALSVARTPTLNSYPLLSTLLEELEVSAGSGGYCTVDLSCSSLSPFIYHFLVMFFLFVCVIALLFR